jgi:GAF domain-containing protein
LLALSTPVRDLSPPSQTPLLDKLLTLQQLAAYDQFKADVAKCATLAAVLDRTLDGAIALHGAQFGNIQLLNIADRTLEIRAHRGFDREFLDAFHSVSIDDPSTCGRALRDNTSVVVRDVMTDVAFAPYRAIAAATGFRGVQSTPAISSAGKIVGVISTHFRRPHAPTRLEMHLIRLYGRCFADALLAHAPEVEAFAAHPLRPEEYA